MNCMCNIPVIKTTLDMISRTGNSKLSGEVVGVQEMLVLKIERDLIVVGS
jgi:hypothetical protein